MQLRADARVPFRRETVFRTYRDDILKLLPYLPNVRSMQTTSRREDGSVVELVNEWRGGGDVPTAIRAVLSDAVLTWTDYATWNADTLRCEWRTQTHAFTDAVRCLGSNAFLEDGPDKTLIEFRGSLDIDAKQVRG